ncbi:hypothetical protein AMECASPLE_028195, partial [Ameca splendens]
DIASGEFASPSPIRTVIAADFDNDKELEVFFNNIAYRGIAPNRLFRLHFQIYRDSIPNHRHTVGHSQIDLGFIFKLDILSRW